MEPRSDYWGLSAWGLIIAALAFVLTKHLWFDSISPDNKVLFWINLCVAGGTLALAAVTFWNVRQTTMVVTAEDRRLQQSFAPYVTAVLDAGKPNDEASTELLGFELRNSGHGIACAVSVVLEAYYTPYPDNDTSPQEQIDLLIAEGKKTWRVSAFCDAISEKGHAKARIYADAYDDTPIFLHEMLIANVSINYLDMFGNSYETFYENWYTRQHRWVRPKHLDNSKGPERHAERQT